MDEMPDASPDNELLRPLDRRLVRLVERSAAVSAGGSRGLSSDLKAGDLIFGNRLSWYQQVMNVSGELFTHVGMIVDMDGQLVVIEVGPGGVFVRETGQFIAAYRHIGVLRPRSHATCRTDVLDHAMAVLARKDAQFGWASIVALETTLVLRRVLPGRLESAISRAGVRCGRWVAKRSDGDTFTCSGFVLHCLLSACTDCHPSLVWPARHRTPPFRGAPSPTDVRARAGGPLLDAETVQALVTPYDLWVTVPAEVRVTMRGDDLTIITDGSNPSLALFERHPSLGGEVNNMNVSVPVPVPA